MARLGVKPAISISHSHGIAVAMASLEPKTHVGIDIETLDRPASHYESLAFRDEERKMLSQVPPARHDEWALRLWTAKEAVSKALGQGFHQGLHSLHITGFDEQSGKVKIELGEALAKMFPKQRGKSIQTVTARNGNLAVATTLLTD
jgi:phosphopantetheine--protein transferase-like protein